MGTFRGFYQKAELLPIPYEAANSNLVMLLLTVQDDQPGPTFILPHGQKFYQHYDFVPLENAVHEVCYVSGQQVQVIIMRNNCNHH